MSGKISEKLDVSFDDVNEIATINGIKIAYGIFEHVTEVTPPGGWFRVIKIEDGTVTLEQRRFVDD